MDDLGNFNAWLCTLWGVGAEIYRKLVVLVSAMLCLCVLQNALFAKRRWSSAPIVYEGLEIAFLFAREGYLSGCSPIGVLGIWFQTSRSVNACLFDESHFI